MNDHFLVHTLINDHLPWNCSVWADTRRKFAPMKHFPLRDSLGEPVSPTVIRFSTRNNSSWNACVCQSEVVALVLSLALDIQIAACFLVSLFSCQHSWFCRWAIPLKRKSEASLKKWLAMPCVQKIPPHNCLVPVSNSHAWLLALLPFCLCRPIANALHFAVLSVRELCLQAVRAVWW